MKRIDYIMPVEWVRGNISGRQDITYDGGDAYTNVPVGSKVAAGNYQPCVVAKVLRLGRPDRLYYYQVRTRTSVNMTAAYRHNVALLGGSGAIYAALVRSKSSPIYIACVNACNNVSPRVTFRAFMMSKLRDGLDNKDAQIVIADGLTIDNPWIYAGTPNVPVPANILTKFASELSN